MKKLIAFALLLISGPLGHAQTPGHPQQTGERVLLVNGYDMHCNHHALVGSQMRLYLTPGDSSYIDLRPEEIIGFETLPSHRPKPAAPATSVHPAPAKRLVHPSPKQEMPADPTAQPAAKPSQQSRAATKMSSADLHEMLAEAAEQHNLDADLLASVVKVGSDGNIYAVSRDGAMGLMQLKPATCKDHGALNCFQPDENLRAGSAYLSELLMRYHDNIALALAAYHAGPEAVDKYQGIPPEHETRVYVAQVIHEFNRRGLSRLSQAQQPTPHLAPIPRAIPMPRARASLSARCSSGHWISGNIDDGKYIHLEDESIWEVAGGDTVDSALWLETDSITVCDGKLINTDENESVEATRIK
jgi:hypothetical protein